MRTPIEKCAGGLPNYFAADLGVMVVVGGAGAGAVGGQIAGARLARARKHRLI